MSAGPTSASPVAQHVPVRVPRHIAIIMDGNGRWAKQRGLSRIEGHRRGVETVRRIVTHAGERGVSFLTLFAFSSENWSRPRDEVRELMGILKRFIRQDLARLHQNGVRVRVLGRRDGLEASVVALLDEAEDLTRGNEAMTLLVAFNYGAQDEIVRAAQRIAAKVAAGELTPDAIDHQCVAAHLDTAGVPDPDLLVRTSGEQRLSNFLLWQCAYTEFVFVDQLWPDFNEASLDAAIDEFNRRDRRFGGIGAAGAG